MTTPAAELHVVFRVGDAEYALDARDVLQMESWSEPTPVPGAAPDVVGVLQIRGRIVPVVDLRRRFGLEPAEAPQRRVVVVTVGERTLGLMVDSSREVVALTAEQITAPPELLEIQSAGLVRGVARLGSRLLLLVDLPTLLHPRSLQATAAEDPHHG